jgi:hypothetical protein
MRRTHAIGVSVFCFQRAIVARCWSSIAPDRSPNDYPRMNKIVPDELLQRDRIARLTVWADSTGLPRAQIAERFGVLERVRATRVVPGRASSGSEPSRVTLWIRSDESGERGGADDAGGSVAVIRWERVGLGSLS